MASHSTIKKFEIHKNNRFLQIAESLKPELRYRKIYACNEIKLEKEQRTVITEVLPIDILYEKHLAKNDSIYVDFGDHAVGYVTLKLSATGSHQDAPAYIYLKFGERLEELTDKIEDYDGWLSRSWIQEEHIHVDELPAVVSLPRRYAFRYMELKVIDTSPKFKLKVDEISCNTVSAVEMDHVKDIDFEDSLLNEIDFVSRKTLKECMQDVFEDGPKRDRRMWLGDLRLQARANYYTFKNYDLAKRCLYIFAGLLFNEGKLSACVFTKPDFEPDDTDLLDYALFFPSAAHDYLKGVMNGRTTIPTKTWKNEYNELFAKKKTLYQKYTTIKDEVKKAEQIQKSVDSILQQEQREHAPHRTQKWEL